LISSPLFSFIILFIYHYHYNRGGGGGGGGGGDDDDDFYLTMMFHDTALNYDEIFSFNILSNLRIFLQIRHY
jgi:hypothetical protein